MGCQGRSHNAAISELEVGTGTRCARRARGRSGFRRRGEVELDRWLQSALAIISPPEAIEVGVAEPLWSLLLTAAGCSCLPHCTPRIRLDRPAGNVEIWVDLKAEGWGRGLADLVGRMFGMGCRWLRRQDDGNWGPRKGAEGCEMWMEL